MANPGGTDIQAPDIDLNEIEVEILIIARNPASLRATAQFLNRRGWPTTVFGNVQKALEFAAEKHPDFVLISFSHQNPAIHQIDALVTQNYNSTCVAFVEKTDALSNQKLMQVKMKNKIFGQSSGPNFQRTIRKILTDRLNLQNVERTQASATAAKDGVGPREPAPLEEEQDALTYRSSGEAEEVADGIHIADGEGSGANPFVQRNGPKRRSLKQLINVKRPQGENAKPELDQESNHPKDLLAQTSATGGKNHILNQDSDGHDLKGRSGASSPGGENQFKAENPDSDGAHAFKKDHSELGSNLPPSPDLEEEIGLLDAGEASDESDSPGADGHLPTSSGPVKIEEHFKILERPSEEALKQVAVVRADLVLKPLSLVQGVAVFPIFSPPGYGYLVFALEEVERMQDREFLDASTKSLQERYKEVNAKATVEPGFFIKIPEVLFDEWTADQAQFTFYWEHLGNEVGVAFFESPKALPAISKKMGMITVGLDDISTHSPISFKAYLHMQMNKRYYLYLREGRLLQDKQKARLKSRSINELFTKSVDLQNLRAYIASAHLAATIQKYKKAS